MTEKRFLITDKARSKYLVLGELSRSQLIDGLMLIGDDLILIEDEPREKENVQIGYWKEKEVFDI